MQWESGSWNDIAGAIYMGAGSEWIWTALSAVLCVVALVVGSRHETDAYKKAERKK